MTQILRYARVDLLRRFLKRVGAAFVEVKRDGPAGFFDKIRNTLVGV